MDIMIIEQSLFHNTEHCLHFQMQYFDSGTFIECIMCVCFYTSCSYIVVNIGKILPFIGNMIKQFFFKLKPNL